MLYLGEVFGSIGVFGRGFVLHVCLVYSDEVFFCIRARFCFAGLFCVFR